MLKYHTFKNLSFDQMNFVKNKLDNLVLKDKIENNIVFFKIKRDDNIITFFYNGTCLIQGRHIQKSVLIISRLLNLNIKDSDIYNIKNIIGSDEVGTGDVFGPIVVCASFVSMENIFFLKEMNIRDSKKISSKRVFQITNLVIKQKIPFVLKILHPLKYNHLIKKNDYNLNKIKALLHNKAILELLEIIKSEKFKFCVVVDQFTSPDNYFNYLKEEKLVYQNIKFETQSENKYLSVALSSVIARCFFLKEIDKLNKYLGMKLKLGASHTVDKQLLEIYQKRGISILNKISKCNFKNVNKITNNYFNLK
ncbi:ribonuclease HIII [Candidatus Phytoplasma sacchari]